MKKTLLSLLVSLPIFCFSQNCTLNIDLPAEIVLCEAGDAFVNPIIDETYESALWTPSTGVANPTSASTTINISADETYTLTIQSISDTELIFNGGFESGDTGFTSDYVYATGGGVGLLSNEGQYAIADDAGDTHNQFAHCSDHSGNGNMMVVNASGDLSNLWCQQITVNQNTDYLFSAWVASVTSQNPAQLQFSINGALIGNVFNASSATCNWQEFFANWNSGTETAAEICIVNSNLTPAGNDFALDDISFREVCVSTASVDISIADLVNTIDGPTEICQDQSTISLDDYLNGSTPGGLWDIDGTAITAINPSDFSAGPHILNYSVSEGNCSSTESLVLTINEGAFAGSDGMENYCQNTFSSVNLNDLLSGADAGGNWERGTGSLPDGNLTNSGSFSDASPTTGIYLFNYIVSQTNGCGADTAFINLEIIAPPVADIPTTSTLDCFEPSIILSGPNTSVGANFDYLWLFNGVPLVDNNVPSLMISEGGFYEMEVFDQTTGCSALAGAVITSLVADINFDLEAIPGDCNIPDSGQLQINNITGGTAPYLVSVNGEDFVAETVFSNLPSGNYEMLVQDAGGCENMQSVELPTLSVPQVSISSSVNGVVKLGSDITLSVSVFPDLINLDTLYWLPSPPGCDGCTQVNFKPQGSETYTVFAIDENGCIGSNSITVLINPKGNLFIPNAISPNADGVNDSFMIYDDGGILEITELNIFDRWGSQVYAGKNLSPNSNSGMWDGKILNQKNAAGGVYIYSAQIQWISGATQTVTGEIHLVH